MAEPRAFFTAKELAHRWHFHYVSIARIIREGRIKGVRISNRWLIPVEEVQRLEREGMKGRMWTTILPIQRMP